MRLGILGAGWIAQKMAEALKDKPHGGECHAIGSRSLDKAQAFARTNGIPKAYGSYEELVKDPDIDLIYIATPHSPHSPHTRLAIENGKPCLVEKAFTANTREAEALIDLARSKNLFITEAIWTRYMPLSMKVKELMDSGIIGEPRLLTATLCYMMEDKERILRPELCGGALLDLGVYSLNFARMYFGKDIIRTVSNCQIGPTGVDLQECISLSYRDGRMANLQAGALCLNDRYRVTRALFGNSRKALDDALDRASRMESYEEAEEYFYGSLAFDPEDSDVSDFMAIIREYLEK